MRHFTTDWFTSYGPQWLERLGHLKDRAVSMLEVGSYEGRSACWLMENILTHNESRLLCVDPWDGTDKTLGIQTIKAYELFKGNTRRYGSRVSHIRDTSTRALAQFITQGRTFDVVFVDGDHEGLTALTDLVMSWHLLKNGGHLVMDDYGWTHEALRSLPKDAWHAFESVKPKGLEWDVVGRLVFARKV